MAKIDKVAEIQGKFTGSEFLLYGDLKGLAKTLEVSEATVYGVYQGVRANTRIKIAIENLISIRKTQLDEAVSQFANDN